MPTEAIPLYDREHLPSDPANWPKYRKRVLTAARDMAGSFRVVTSETENEPFLCQDGYLAIDARGYPYAISRDEFELIYERVAGER